MQHVQGLYGIIDALDGGEPAQVVIFQFELITARSYRFRDRSIEDGVGVFKGSGKIIDRNWRCQFGGSRRCGGAQVRHKISNGEISFMPHARDNGHT